ncbi:3-dehydroquinate synthase [Syntrophus aciditrophicus]|uniref:3-dehydroquinate synthase n=1 Tax=Syntrophus aciditrophicus (strain SB) TaxID=56780 RepID=Q2LUD2_SYNAS|nr:3-dehydroquinate synthase [Syntrophus aciditrophicus]ABC77696.1 3-dehydroquinate synthase [Syntrophus aciditrophicus SB]OPY16790.1 MAG: 3-dehydroquinate synthase [Syntrophus sp. PtaB.Bin075]
MKRIKVHLDKRLSETHEICIGYDFQDRIGLLIAKEHPANRYVIVTDSNVSGLYGKTFLEKLRELGLPAELLEFPAGEGSKTMDTVLALTSRLLERGVDRHSLLLALGGGVVGDLTGFVASIYMRSVPFIQIPTTLMAQVDSSIGGKTAVNLPQGKNLLGTFYQPKRIFTDLKFLETLSDDEYLNGVAEIVKYGVIDEPGFFELLEREVPAIRERNLEVLKKVIEQSCRIKKGVVEIDEQESGFRRILNYGHTIGHALEASSNFTLAHGKAVALGMIAASGISVQSGYLSLEERDRIENMIRDLGLPVRIPESFPQSNVLERLQMDKKKEGSELPFVLLKKIGIPFITKGVEKSHLEKVLEEMKA